MGQIRRINGCYVEGESTGPESRASPFVICMEIVSTFIKRVQFKFRGKDSVCQFIQFIVKLFLNYYHGPQNLRAGSFVLH